MKLMKTENHRVRSKVKKIVITLTEGITTVSMIPMRALKLSENVVITMALSWQYVAMERFN